jgi:hypothetical protein
VDGYVCSISLGPKLKISTPYFVSILSGEENALTGKCWALAPPIIFPQIVVLTYFGSTKTFY